MINLLLFLLSMGFILIDLYMSRKKNTIEIMCTAKFYHSTQSKRIQDFMFRFLFIVDIFLLLKGLGRINSSFLLFFLLLSFDFYFMAAYQPHNAYDTEDFVVFITISTKQLIVPFTN